MSDLLNSASLVMIPSGYKEDVVYSEVPTNGNGDLSFTRASNGTRVNSAGLVEDVPWNIVQQSETFNTGWSFNLATVTSNSQTAPNGTLTADTLNSTTTQYSGIYQGIGTLPTNAYTYSMYAKAGTNNFFYMLGQGQGSQIAFFNLSTGVVTSTSNLDSASIENVGNGWYRCQIQKTGAGVEMFVASSNIENTTATASGTVFIWGAQTNIGSTAKPYFPTTDRLNVPRLTYQNGGGGCPSLLLEKQSTNLCVESNAFNTSPWVSGSQSGTNPVITPNYGISPDGTQNAVRIELARQNVGTSYSQIYQHPIAITSGQPYTWSVYLKSLSGTPTISIIGDFGRPSVTLTSEWVRYTGTGTTSNSQTQLELAILGSNYATGNSLSADFLAYGYQIEQSSYPTSYIPTTSSSATRVVDVCSKTGISSLIGQTEGTLFIDINITKLTDNEAIGTINSGGYANNTTLQRIGNTIQFVRNSATQSGASVETQTIAIGRHKMAIAYKSGNTAFYLDGSQVSTTQTQTFTNGTLSVLNLGTDAIGALPITESYNQAILFPTRLTNAELASLTTL